MADRLCYFDTFCELFHSSKKIIQNIYDHLWWSFFLFSNQKKKLIHYRWICKVIACSVIKKKKLKKIVVMKAAEKKEFTKLVANFFEVFSSSEKKSVKKRILFVLSIFVFWFGPTKFTKNWTQTTIKNKTDRKEKGQIWTEGLSCRVFFFRVFGSEVLKEKERERGQTCKSRRHPESCRTSHDFVRFVPKPILHFK